MTEIDRNTKISDIFLTEYDKGDRIPVRLVNALSRQNIYTLGDLIDICKDDERSLMRIRNFGVGCMDKINTTFVALIEDSTKYRVDLELIDDIKTVIRSSKFDNSKYQKAKKTKAGKVIKYAEKYYGPFGKDSRKILAKAINSAAETVMASEYGFYPAAVGMLYDISDCLENDIGG